MKKIGFIANLEKPGVKDIVLEAAGWLEKRGVEPLVLKSNSLKLGCPWWGAEPEILASADCVLSLGGDGTLLRAARILAPSGTPILGVNLGHLGFLTEVEVRELLPALEKLLSGHFRIEERMMLASFLERTGTRKHYWALNDVVLTKGAFSRMLRLKVYIGPHYLDTYRADGLIISTPTGSTAYCLSAGGPLVSPELKVMVLTPICPHTLYARPLVVPAEQQIRVQVCTAGAEVMLTVDGQQGIDLVYGDEVIVTRASFPARLVRLKERSFYSLLREKFREGE